MFLKIFLCFCTLRFYSVWGQGKCTDSRGTLISHGMHYVPGPDTCTLCVCDNGLPKVCKAVLCSPPQDCRSFRVGNTCCDFICLDDVVNPVEGTEANVRLAAGGAATVVLLTVALIVYRVKKQKRRHPTHADDQRSLTSIGYISGSMGYMGGTCETALGGWKPSGNYLPRGEAPPPYDEAIQCRDSIRLNNEGSYHRTYPAGVEALSRADDMQCGHGYVNIPRPITQLANTQNCYNAPLLQPAHPVHPVHPTHQAHPTHPTDARDTNSLAHHTLAPNGVGVGVVGFPSAIRLTGSLGAISSRALLSVARDHDHMPAFYTNSAALSADMHRTIPRLSSGGSGDGDSGELFGRGERVLHAEVRRSFHKPGEGKRHVHRADTGRSVPRNLHVAHRPTHPAHVTHPTHSVHQTHPVDDANIRTSADGRARAHEEQPTEEKPPPPQPAADSAPHSTLPLTVDKPSCVCSYEQSGAPGSEETDDYRNECENCKSASSSRWAVEEGWGGVGEEGEGTQTLQRRAPPPAPPPVATATLPQPVTKQSRTLMGPPSNWENWFNTIPDSDTESEEE